VGEGEKKREGEEKKRKCLRKRLTQAYMCEKRLSKETHMCEKRPAKEMHM